MSPMVAMDAVPPGAWAVGVSGGADSVALLELLRGRKDLQVYVAHLDHQARGADSAADAEFVRELAARWGLAATVSRLSDVENDEIRRENNRAARFRAARFALFRRVVRSHNLRGVILAHHADDQAETVLQRLLRGSGPAGLVGMPASGTIGGLTVLRPLLSVTRESLRALLVQRGIVWREDPSNEAPSQQRNRVRQWLSERPKMRGRLLELVRACRAMTHWLREHSPMLGDSFEVTALQAVPQTLARESARRWLAARAGTGAEIPPAAIDRLILMATDAATPVRQHFPGGVLVRRKGGRISAAIASALSPAESTSMPPEST